MKKSFLILSILLMSSRIAFSQYIVSISPDSGRIFETISATITGENIDFTKVTKDLSPVSIVKGLQLSKDNTVISSTGWTVLSPTQIKGNFTLSGSYYNCNIPIGNYDVSVLISDSGNTTKAITGAGLFTMLTANEKIVSLTPNSAKQNQYVSVSIVGENTCFAGYQGATYVTFVKSVVFSGKSQFQTSSVSAFGPNQLTLNATIPTDADSGYYDVILKFDNSKEIIGKNIFYVIEKSHNTDIVDISPNYATLFRDVSVTITGENVDFTTLTTGFTPSYIIRKVSNVELIKDTTVITSKGWTVRTPTTMDCSFSFDPTPKDTTGMTGSYDVVVSISDSGIIKKVIGSKLFQVFPSNEQIYQVSPNDGNQNSTLNVSIFGQNTQFCRYSGSTPVSNIEKVIFSGGSTFEANIQNVSLYQIYTQLDIPVDASTGLYDVVVKYKNSRALVGPGMFTVNPRITDTVISNITPNSATISNQINTTIIGQNVDFQQHQQGSTMTYCLKNVYLKRGSDVVEATDFYPTGKMTLAATFKLPDDIIPGNYDVIVSQQCSVEPVTYIIGKNLFSVNPQSQGSIISVNPDTSAPGNKLDVEITGQNTYFQNYHYLTGMVSIIVESYLKKGDYAIYMTNSTPQSNTVLDASLSIPSDAPIGYYNTVVCCYNGQSKVLTYTGENLFAVLPDSQKVGVYPPQGTPGCIVIINVNDVQTDISGQTLTDVYLQSSPLSSLTQKSGGSGKIIIPVNIKNSSDNILSNQIKIEAVSYEKTGSRSIKATFNLPNDAGQGRYDLVIETDHKDVSEIPAAFNIEEPKSVKDNLIPDGFITNLELSPNLNSGNFTISFDSKVDGMAYVDIINPLGMTIENSLLGNVSQGSNNLKLNLSQLPSGYYLVVVSIGKHVAIGKIIIEK